MKKGYMIVCDGGDGAGKTTVIDAIKEHLKSRGCDIVVTREPGGTAIGNKIREVVLSKDTPEMSDTTELMLFAADRAQHVREKIIPAINKGKMVISDRFDSATISFQHYARGLPIELIQNLNGIALDGFKPDMTIILDIDPVTGLERINSRKEEKDRMEDQDMLFRHNVRQGYLEQAKNDPDHFEVVDASEPLDIVVSNVLKIIDSVIKPTPM